jgi:hypothetical protein
MNSQKPHKLILNIIPISFSSDKIEIGRQPKLGKKEYQELRESYWRTHSFRYDHRTEEVLNIPISQDKGPLGSVDEVLIQDHLLLIGRAVQQNILVWLADKLPILKSSKRLVFWGQAESALLLTRSVENLGLPRIPDLEVVLRYEIDCRLFYYEEDKPYLGLVVDLGTSNIIDIPTSDLQAKGFNLIGRYVCTRTELESEYLHPKLNLLGRVSETKGSTLYLIDTEGVQQIESDNALLEPRQENLRDVLRLYYGNRAPKVLSELDKFRQPISTAPGKLSRIRSTLSQLGKQQIIIGKNVTVEFGDLLNEDDERFPQSITTKRPTLLFGPQGRKRGVYPDPSISTHGPYMYMQHERNDPLIAVVCEGRYRGRVEQFMQLLLNGFPNELWKNKRKGNPYSQGLIEKYRLSKTRLEFEECTGTSPEEYREAINRLLGRLQPAIPDLAFVQIRENFTQLFGSSNPYLVSKALFMMSGVPTQSIRIEKINTQSESIAYLLNTISLATYAKLDGTPWVILTLRPTTHELIIGLGSAEVSSGRLADKRRYVGITSVFQGDGRYLIWGATREVEFEHYTEALLESLRTTVKYVQQHNAWQEGDRVRLVFHVYKRLRDCEVQAIKSLVRELTNKNFNVEFAFLDISSWHPYHIFDPAQVGTKYWDWGLQKERIKGKGIPDRGTCFQLDKSRGLLHLVGPSDIKTTEQGTPRPLLVELHYDSDFTDLAYLLRQIYHFSYMSWRSFTPGTEPITITYSRLIARLLGNLKTVSGWNNRVVTYGNLKDRRWFL